MKIAIIGSSGMAGSMIYTYLKNEGYDVVGFSRHEVKGLTDERLNIIYDDDLDNLLCWIPTAKPDAIINCIGCLVKESSENNDLAAYINGTFPHILARACKDLKTKVIHLSTDCIFNGLTDFPYTELELPNERGFYGRSKALGEINNTKDLTLRQSIIGPAPQENNTGFLNWLLTEKNKDIFGYSNVLWNGITTLELAKNIQNILERQMHLSGIYHLVPKKYISKYELIKLIKDIWGLSFNIKDHSKSSSFKILKNTRNILPDPPTYKKQLIELYDYMKLHNIKVADIK